MLSLRERPGLLAELGLDPILQRAHQAIESGAVSD